MAVFDIKFLQRLYTLAADPITEEKTSLRGGTQGPTRPFVDWMDAVNAALIDLLTESTFAIDDDYLLDQGFAKDANGDWQLNDLLFEGSDVIRFNTACDVYISGITAGRPSQQVDILALGAGAVFLLNASGLSLPANQILTTPRSTIALAPGVGFARLYYDGVGDLWRVILHEQGSPLTPPLDFLAVAFSADGGDWSVPQVDVFTYYLKGAMLQINLRLLGTQVTGPADRLRILLPNSMTARKHMATLGFVRDDNTPLTGKATLWQCDSGSPDMNIEHMNGEGISGNGVDVLGQYWLEVGTLGETNGQLGGPGGSGSGQTPFRTGGEPPLPNELALITQYANDFRTEFLESCLSQGGSLKWLDRVVAALRAKDSRWGYTGQRGLVGDIAEDAITYYWGPGEPWVGALENDVIDIITGHCPTATSGEPTPSFNDVTAPGIAAAWVFPRGASPETNPNPNVPVDETTSPPGGDAVGTGSITFHSARNPSGWTKTSNLTSVRVSTSQTCLDHSKKSVWSNGTLGNGVVVNANAWVGIQISGVWHMSTWEYFRPGQTCKGLQLGSRVIWDDHVMSPLRGNAPVAGDSVLFMMSTLARNGNDPNNGQERSNIVQITWPY